MLNIYFLISCIMAGIHGKKYVIETHDAASASKNDHSVGGSDYQSLPDTCMAGYPCNGICPVCECQNQVENRVRCPSSEWRRFKNHCYLLLKNHRSMERCRDECRRKGGDLASIHSREENDVVAEMIRQRPSHKSRRQVLQ